ncbi:GP46-like surface antigen, putative [Bodo saltans]|uniref:GP46-like surface antigen, putative n=1 Tax=Bodo saltans TaxID=75058 RepID=A0A0S4KJT6_BODSA|nr:GP46-like surface antigen, putative [Bodo saltans]|eukprot:CUI14810.1 GP46-like surface antigen, putative [Bodo saltans]
MLDVSSNNLSGTIPVQYAAWKSIDKLRHDSNSLSGTLPNSLFGGWTFVVDINMRMNGIIGTIPPALLARPALQKLYLGHNMFAGTMPSTIAMSVELLDLQNNSGLVGTLPFRLMLVTVCGTGVCSTGSLPLQYCLPATAAELKFAQLAPYASICTPSNEPTLSTATPLAINSTSGNTTSSQQSLARGTRSIGAAVAFASTIVAGGGAVRGAVPGLQRATTALRLALLCFADRGASEAMFCDPSSNAIGLSVPVGSSGLECAAGAAIGNAVLVVAVAMCLHSVALLRGYSRMIAAPISSTARSALWMLPASLLGP